MLTINGKMLAHPFMSGRVLDAMDQMHWELAYAGTGDRRNKILTQITGTLHYTPSEADDAWSYAMFLSECGKNGWIQ